MGVKLLFKAVLFISSLFILLQPAVFNSTLSAQVAITDAAQFDLSFTESNTQSTSRFLRLSVNDLQEFLGNTYSERLSDQQNPETPFSGAGYIMDGGSVAITGLKPDDSDPGVFSDLSFVNRTSESFDELTIAFDFLYRLTDDTEPFSLQLQAKTGNGKWTNLRGGQISSRELSRSDGGWNSFSVQAHTNELFLRPDDQVRLRWHSPDAGDDIIFPLALQSVDLSPVISQRRGPERGSVVITELLIPTRTAVGEMEYLELYNPTEDSVSLKGLVIETPGGEVVIERELYLEPYGFFVLSSDLAERANFIESQYEYGTPILGDRSGGYVILRFGEREIARATYENAEPGTALELSRVSGSHDGYTSLQDLNPVSESLTTNVRGTPGEAGGTVRLYSRMVNRGGWHLVSAPGHLNSSLNRSLDSEFRSLMDTPFRMQDTRPGEPFLLYRDSDSPYRLYAEEQRAGAPLFSHFDIDENTTLVTMNRPAQGITINSIADELGRPVSPALLNWDADRQSFRVIHKSDEPLSGWSPLAINSRAAMPTRLLDPDRTSGAEQLEGYMNLKLFLDSDRTTSRVAADETVIGFMEKQRMERGQRFDLPRLYPFSREEDQPSPIIMMYLSNRESPLRTNHFTHLPFQIEQPFTVGVGTFSSRDYSQAVLDWSDMQNIPDEWIITLEDRVTGARIDMRDQTSYNFRLLSNGERDYTGMASEPFTTFIPDEDDRFQITIKPYNAPAEVTSTSGSRDSVELLPNYPNPFNPATNIAFHLPEERPVKLGIYNIVGQQIALLADDVMSQGDHTITWNAADHPSGIYIVQLETGNRIYTRKITLIK